MKRKRDSQRSRVYEWEHPFTKTESTRFHTLEEVESYLKPIWRSERGRYGRAKAKMPELRPGHGARHAHGNAYRIRLPRWARTPWVILHETAHALVPDAQHGPRFVGVLIGLLSRHCGFDCDELMASADEMGVKYDARSIGAVPVTSKPEKLLRLVQKSKQKLTVMEAACELDWHWREVAGALLGLRRCGVARLYRNRIVLLPQVPS